MCCTCSTHFQAVLAQSNFSLARTQVAPCARRSQQWLLPTQGRGGAQGRGDFSPASKKPCVVTHRAPPRRHCTSPPIIKVKRQRSAKGDASMCHPGAPGGRVEPHFKEAALAVPEGTAEILVVKEDPSLQLTVRGARPEHAPGGFPRLESQRAVPSSSRRTRSDRRRAQLPVAEACMSKAILKPLKTHKGAEFKNAC